MEIDLLYVPGCPNRAAARDVVELALARTRLPAVASEREIRSGEEAERLGMRGSPTILIDGRDPFARGADAPGLSCRLYHSDAGLSGVPTVSQLVVALGG